MKYQLPVNILFVKHRYLSKSIMLRQTTN